MNRFHPIEYDGHFFVEDKKIYFLIVDDNKPPVYLKDGTVKLTRYFNFYDESKHSLGCIAVYDTEEQLHNITSDYAQEKYLKLISKK